MYYVCFERNKGFLTSFKTNSQQRIFLEKNFIHYHLFFMNAKLRMFLPFISIISLNKYRFNIFYTSISSNILTNNSPIQLIEPSWSYFLVVNALESKFVKNQNEQLAQYYITKEDMNKQPQSSHLHFYHRGEHGKSLDHYKQVRLYSHIADEYNFRIGNKLMVQKIVNPRRDKTIMDSLIHASPKYILRKKKIVAKEIREVDDRRNQELFESKKKENKHAECYEMQQVRTKCGKRQKSGLFRSMDQTISMHNQIHPLKQSQREEAFMNSFETRDCSLRNNFVGKIVKNQKRQPQKYNYNYKNSTSRNGISLFTEVAHNQTLRESYENNSIYRSSHYKSIKQKHIKQTSQNKRRGHYRQLSTQTMKENSVCYQPLGGNSRNINSLF